MSVRGFGKCASIGGLVAVTASLLADVLPWSTPRFGFRQSTGVLAGFLLLLLGWALKAKARRDISAPMLSILLTLISLGLLVDAVWVVASSQQGADLTYDATTGPAKVLTTLASAGLSGTGVCRCLPDRVSRLPLPDEFHTELSVYQKPGEGRRPGILLIHGNTWRGQRLSTYRLVATLLAQRGYVVASFDKLGFGRADDPFERTPSTSTRAGDTDAQTRAAIDQLLKLESVDPGSISVLGHSAGVNEALIAGLDHRAVSSVIVMPSPPPAHFDPRNLPERLEYFGRRYRSQYELVYGRSVPDAFSDYVEAEVRRGASVPWERYRQPGHVPLLVLLGEHDQPQGHDEVRDIVSNLAEPKKMVLIQGSDHYVNTAQSLGLVVYDRDVAGRLVSAIDSWLQARLDGNVAGLSTRRD